MASPETIDVATRAKRLYEDRLRAALEGTHDGEYAAVEPESGEYFLGRTMSAAVAAARDAHPDRLSFVIRVGHPTALHLGEVRC